MTAYYNEIDPYAAQWLRNLMAAGHIATGDVDERSIVDVSADDLRGYQQCHFFAGVGVWSYALRLAGWPDERPVWTGSCPCQPFSAAGKGLGTEDDRHLWPVFSRLIKQRAAPIVFGEQVASAAALDWWDIVSTDLENAGYAAGSADLCAAGVGAPHIRQRLFWVGYSDDAGLEGYWGGHQTKGRHGETAFRPATPAGKSGAVADTKSEGLPHRGSRSAQPLIAAPHGSGSATTASPTNGFWRDADWLLCRDGKWRPVEPGASPLAHGSPARVGRLRAYGNAIVPQVAAEFIRAVMELRP